MIKSNGAIVFLLACCVLVGCTGHINPPQFSGDTGPPIVEPAIESHEGLPDIGELTVPNHEASLLGPGWFEIQPQNEYFQAQSFGAIGMPGGRVNVTGLGLGIGGWAIYGVRGFDGDISPTSVRVNSESVTGEYYVGFSDYSAKHWKFAGPFAASAEAQIPDMGSHASPLAFISPAQTFFFAIVVQDDNNVVINSFDVGIHGGSNAPEPPSNFVAAGGETELELVWEPSLSANDLDFAGYILQRAPLLYGSYETVSAEVVTDNYFVDTAVSENTQYRYRIAAVDSSGNQSAFRGVSGGAYTAPLSESDPVAIIDCPTGPFMGPMVVTFDLSRSYDPAGGVIDTYQMVTTGLSQISGPNTTYQMTLQPGTYIIEATVKVGSRSGSTKKLLKVLPAWETESVEAYSGSGNLPRMKFIRSGLLPDGNPVALGYDPTIPSLAIWGRRDGEFTFQQLGAILGFFSSPPSFIGEPIHIGDSLMVPVIMGNIIVFVTFNNVSAQVVGILPASGILGGSCSIFKLPGETLGVIFPLETGGITDLNYAVIGSSGSIETVKANVGTISTFDAIYNPDTETIDIVYANGASTNWSRFTPGVGETASFSWGAFDAHAVDIELDLATGRPAVAHVLDLVPPTARYQLLSDDNLTWGAAFDVDLSDDNTYPGDLVINTQGTFYLGGLEGGGNPTFHLYELVAGVWTVRNTSISELSDTTNMNLNMDESTGDAFAVGHDKNGSSHIETFSTDGSVSEDWSLLPAAGFGREMHGTSGSDGLHVIFSQADTGMVTHLSETGSGWTDQGHPFALGAVTDLDIASTSMGEVYASFIDFNSAELHYWDGANWILQQNYPALEGHRPGLMDQPLQEVMNWAVYLQPANIFRYVNGSQTTPFTFTAVNPADTPIWNCSVSAGEFTAFGQANVLVNATGTSAVAGKVGFFGHGTSSMAEIASYVPFKGIPETWGRTMETCPYETLDRTTRVYWINFGHNDGSLIYERISTQTSETIIPLEYDKGDNQFNVDLRRTISMGYARGGTAIALVGDIPGEHPQFLWSNFGNWEDIPLPDDLTTEEGRMSMPELIIGEDGRWHIVYHDYLEDKIMVRSTL